MKALEIETKQNQTYAAFLGHNLISSAEADYITMRSIIVLCGSVVFSSKIMQNGAECLEKIMKAFLREVAKISPEELKNYKHNLEKIRSSAAKINPFFEDADLEDFCKNYSKGRGNELLKYGFQDNTGSHGGDLTKLLNLVDKFFLGSLTKLSPSLFTAANTKIAALFCETIFTKFLPTLHTPSQIKNLQDAISTENVFLEDFTREVNKYLSTVVTSP